MADEVQIEKYRDYFIKTNRVPEDQFPKPAGISNQSGGFGWTFGVSPDNPQKPRLILVIKYPQSDFDEADIQTVLSIGQEIVRTLIDGDKVSEGGYFCYWWDPITGVQQDDCDNVSPHEFRTDLWK